MKQPDNNEIELLLRSLAKHKGIDSPAHDAMSEAFANDVHLDVDELNSYAEGVLPAPARARYTAHLADCDRCRGIVTQLTLETGASDRHKQIEQEVGVTFWQKLAVFFSPPVLRYAIPAFLVFAVIAVGVVALRQQRRSELVAQNQPASPQAAATEITDARLKEKGNDASVTTADRPLAKSSNAAPTTDKEAKGSPKGGVAQESRSADSVSVASGKESPESAVASSAAAEPSYAPEPGAVPPAATPRTTLADSAKPQSAAKGKPTESDAPSRQREDAKIGAKDEAAENRVAVAKLGAGSVAGNVQGNRTEEARRGSGASGRVEKKTESETETRAVAGRRFRRQGNVWVDTAYESSRPTINVARGSEQYRALVADEPSIRTIAEQLSGEVVVVWKGRAYWIH